MSATTRKNKRSYPHGAGIPPEDVKDDDAVADLFVTLAFFARLGFVQPPCCLKCAHRESGCGTKAKEDGTRRRSCTELVPWRKDANAKFHPDMIEDNIIFVTCQTARSLVAGDCYADIRWDSKNKRLLHEI